jgi:hypothetical protein
MVSMAGPTMAGVRRAVKMKREMTTDVLDEDFTTARRLPLRNDSLTLGAPQVDS